MCEELMIADQISEERIVGLMNREQRSEESLTEELMNEIPMPGGQMNQELMHTEMMTQELLSLDSELVNSGLQLSCLQVLGLDEKVPK